MSAGRHVPANALLVMGAIPAVIALSALWLQDAIATIISFAAVGIYIAFQMVVLAALIARAKGWRPSGEFKLAGWGWFVNLIALAYGVGAIINILWPRSPNDPWYVELRHVGDHRGHHCSRQASTWSWPGPTSTARRRRGMRTGWTRGKRPGQPSKRSGKRMSRRRLTDRVPRSRHCPHRRSNSCR